MPSTPLRSPEITCGEARRSTPGELDAYADELWTGLISRVVKTAGSSPALVGDLMDALGAVDGVDPRRVLAATPVGTEVEGARIGCDAS